MLIHTCRATKLVVATTWRKHAGLQRVLVYRSLNNIVVDILVTDRHRQIAKWIREEHQEIKHYYDVWHVAKGIYLQSHTSFAF